MPLTANRVIQIQVQILKKKIALLNTRAKKIFSSKLKMLLIIDPAKANNIAKTHPGADWRIIIN